LRLLNIAVARLTASKHLAVYIDAGHPKWVPAPEIGARLLQAGVADARGFSLNVSNFVTTEENLAYGSQISGVTGDKHFVIDTSRNGLGAKSRWDGSVDWCNPDGRALGRRPTLETGRDLVDAFLWIKRPGESDGKCNGGPKAGVWWPDYATSLAERAAW
jgi:endoglucanase